MQYLVLIHNNARIQPSDEEWTHFFSEAKESCLFVGGSSIRQRAVIGSTDLQTLSSTLSGFMRFDSDCPGDLHALLQKHPIVRHGGSIELFEMPVD